MRWSTARLSRDVLDVDEKSVPIDAAYPESECAAIVLERAGKNMSQQCGIKRAFQVSLVNPGATNSSHNYYVFGSIKAQWNTLWEKMLQSVPHVRFRDVFEFNIVSFILFYKQNLITVWLLSEGFGCVIVSTLKCDCLYAFQFDANLQILGSRRNPVPLTGHLNVIK